ncbi:MAG: hypothetical protein ACRDT9_03955 [Agromyces sp.]
MNPAERRDWREDCRDSEGRPLSQDHERAVSPFIERAESADVGTDVHVMPDSPVAAASVVGEVPSVLPGRHARHHRTDVWSRAAAGSFFGAALVVLALTIGGVL